MGNDRVLIAFDGKSWFVRSIAQVAHDGERDEMVYLCDKPISGPHPTLKEAAESAGTRQSLPPIGADDGLVALVLSL